jgi:hypothetical protein
MDSITNLAAYTYSSNGYLLLTWNYPVPSHNFFSISATGFGTSFYSSSNFLNPIDTTNPQDTWNELKSRLNKCNKEDCWLKEISNEKIRGVRLLLTKDSLAVVCSNNEQEEAQEELEVAYNSEALDIGFNIAYLLDVLNHLSVEKVECHFGDSNSSVLITVPGQDDFKYVVMPMRI